jgi:protein phosphatase PTC6
MKNSEGTTFRIQLAKSRSFVGIRSTRCQREYNQDRYKIMVLNPTSLSPEVVSTLKDKKGGNRNTEGAQMDAKNKTLFYFAIFDGHGGSNTSDFLTAHLDSYIDEAKPSMVPDLIQSLRKIGGYFRSFRPDILEAFLPLDFEKRYGGRRPEKSKIQIKGKGGRVKQMIFIPHPNATEEEQQEAINYLEHQSGVAQAASNDNKHPQPSSIAGKESSDHTEDKEKSKENKEKEEEKKKEKAQKGDDPYEAAKEKYRSGVSVLPEASVEYSGASRWEYESLVIRDNRYYDDVDNYVEAATPTTMTLEQRLYSAFLRCDSELVRDKYRDGSTASVVVVQSRGPYWETQEDLDLIIAHVGDTRILLCEAPNGEAIQLTTDHHPDATVESGIHM